MARISPPSRTEPLGRAAASRRWVARPDRAAGPSPAVPSRWTAQCTGDDGRMDGIEITGEVVEWRGPAPFHFVRVDGEQAEVVDDLGRPVSYGWGMVPVEVEIGATRWTTSLWPKDGGYLLPVKDAVRRREGIELGDTVTARLEIRG